MNKEKRLMREEKRNPDFHLFSSLFSLSEKGIAHG